MSVSQKLTTTVLVSKQEKARLVGAPLKRTEDLTMINDSGDRYLSTAIFGVKKKVRAPKRKHGLDVYSSDQLEKYQSRFEIIEPK